MQYLHKKKKTSSSDERIMISNSKALDKEIECAKAASKSETKMLLLGSGGLFVHVSLTCRWW